MGKGEMGVNGETGQIMDLKTEYPIWDLYTTKIAVVKTALE
jgi:hypothetical protein